jgi:hypothetical protein
MELLGVTPYSLSQGDDIFAKVQSVNDIGTSRPSEEGSGAKFTECENGVPDKVVIKNMAEFRSATSLKISIEQGKCDGNLPV